MNRRITTPEFRVIYQLRIGKSKISGRGAYASGPIPVRKKIGDLGGVIIPLREARRLVKQSKVISMVEFGNGYALNASIDSNALRFINHSCSPNTYMRVTHNRVEFYALRTIRTGEELSCDYGATHHDGKLPCTCGAKNCRGFI
ncbi:MAG: SET domain-containing protein-lysine N-methyltransferase [Chitinophagaceae bacterium]|nr:SET domain-containing protein-lysine N-methyltransferase [Chitinophagaceae bacterium]